VQRRHLFAPRRDPAAREEAKEEDAAKQEECRRQAEELPQRGHHDQSHQPFEALARLFMGRRQGASQAQRSTECGVPSAQRAARVLDRNGYGAPVPTRSRAVSPCRLLRGRRAYLRAAADGLVHGITHTPVFTSAVYALQGDWC